MRHDWEASEAALESSQKMPLHPSALGIAPPVPGRVKGAGMAFYLAAAVGMHVVAAMTALDVAAAEANAG